MIINSRVKAFEELGKYGVRVWDDPKLPAPSGFLFERGTKPLTGEEAGKLYREHYRSTRIGGNKSLSDATFQLILDEAQARREQIIREQTDAELTACVTDEEMEKALQLARAKDPMQCVGTFVRTIAARVVRRRG